MKHIECVTTGIECYETIFKSKSNMETDSIIQRDMLYRQTSPEGYKFGMLRFLYLDSSDKMKIYTRISGLTFFIH
ncbi:MAG TPA: hypothetical protein PLF27_11620 [Sedimentibacter sp.]|nr:hypothetical protein [Pseudobacteroides sp.]HRC82022.1 hypothetical protein [Sedimentibacter sp.]